MRLPAAPVQSRRHPLPQSSRQTAEHPIPRPRYRTGKPCCRHNVSIDVYPHDDGTASIQLNNDAQKHWGGSITIDNKGSKPNTTTLRGSLNVGSPLGLSDSLYLNGYTNLNNHDSHTVAAAACSTKFLTAHGHSALTPLRRNRKAS